MKKFPHAFLWGAATSAHQVEGQNIYNDWWQAEQEHLLKEASRLACKHYELYAEDFAIAKQLNHNCHRFSIESRTGGGENPGGTGTRTRISGSKILSLGAGRREIT